MSNLVGDSLAVSGAASIGGGATIQGNTQINGSLIIKGWLDAVNVRDIYKGIFSSKANLDATYPNPKDGWIAGVGPVESSYTAYIGQSGEWVNTGSTYTPSGQTIDVQAIWTAIGQKANASEMSVSSVSGDTTKKKIQLKNGLSVNVVVSHQDISGKANASEMSITHGTGANADKTTMQLKNGMSATLLNSHQDISGKADTDNVYTKAQVVEKLGETVGEVLRCTYVFGGSGEYTLCNSDELLFVVIKGIGYESGTVTLDSGTHTASFVFTNPSKIPNKAFQDVVGLQKIHIPSHIHEIGDNAFNGCIDVDYVECEGMTPPSVGSGAFDEVNLTNATLKVHNLVSSDYGTDEFWGIFGTQTTF